MTNQDQSAIPPVVEASNLMLGYGQKVILRNVHLKIMAGDFWFIVGRNGSGKTTLVKSLLRQLIPMEGKLVFGGTFSNRSQLGFVPQFNQSDDTIPTTVEEFITLGSVGLKYSKSQLKNNLQYAIERTYLTDLVGQSYWSLSGGQQQRVRIARALIRCPQVIIADEPTSGLDVDIQRLLLQQLWEFNQQDGITLIVVSHNLTAVDHYGTHCAFVSDNTVRVLEQAAFAELPDLFGEVV